MVFQKQKTDLNTKIIEKEGKIPSITGLATNLPLTAVGNKIPNISGLVKKQTIAQKINEIEYKVSDHNHDKHFTTLELSNLAARVLNERLAQVDLVAKADFDTKLKILSKRIT